MTKVTSCPFILTTTKTDAMIKDASNTLGYRMRCIILVVLLGLSGTLSHAQCPVTILPSTYEVSCNGSPIQFTASGGTNYLWYYDTPDSEPIGSGSTFMATIS